MANAQFQKGAGRVDPYKNYNFRVKWDGKYVAGVSKVGGLKRSTDVVKHRSGGDASAVHAVPGQSAFEAITLERGVTHDADFAAWASKVRDYKNSTQADGSAAELVAPKDFRKDITIETVNEAGETVMAYNVSRCWVSEYQVVPELDAASNGIAIQSIKLENEGWERDESVQEPE